MENNNNISIRIYNFNKNSENIKININKEEFDTILIHFNNNDLFFNPNENSNNKNVFVIEFNNNDSIISKYSLLDIDQIKNYINELLSNENQQKEFVDKDNAYGYVILTQYDNGEDEEDIFLDIYNDEEEEDYLFKPISTDHLISNKIYLNQEEYEFLLEHYKYVEDLYPIEFGLSTIIEFSKNPNHPVNINNRPTDYDDLFGNQDLDPELEGPIYIHKTNMNKLLHQFKLRQGKIKK